MVTCCEPLDVKYENFNRQPPDYYHIHEKTKIMMTVFFIFVPQHNAFTYL